MRARLRVVKSAATLAVVEGNAPTVAVRAALATAPHQPGKAEADIGRHVGIHSQELAQGSRYLRPADIMPTLPVTRESLLASNGASCSARCPMPSDPKTFNPFPHDWHSTDYVSGWITHDVARDPDRRPLLRQMLSFAPFPCESGLEILDLGAGYGVVTEEVLQAFPAARVILQDYSQPMLDQARRRTSTADQRAPSARPPERVRISPRTRRSGQVRVP